MRARCRSSTRAGCARAPAVTLGGPPPADGSGTSHVCLIELREGRAPYFYCRHEGLAGAGAFTLMWRNTAAEAAASERGEGGAGGKGGGPLAEPAACDSG